MVGLINIVILSAIVAIVLAIRFFAGGYATVTLVEYQRGVIYRNGLPVRNVGPGRYRVWSGFEKILHLDSRPVQVSYENQSVGLRDGPAAQYSLFGSAELRDVRKAIYSSTNAALIPSYVLLCCARSVLNASTSNELKLSRDAVVAKIMERAKPRLDAAGFELLSFRLPQIAIRGDVVEQTELES